MADTSSSPADAALAARRREIYIEERQAGRRVAGAAKAQDRLRDIFAEDEAGRLQSEAQAAYVRHQLQGRDGRAAELRTDLQSTHFQFGLRDGDHSGTVFRESYKGDKVGERAQPVVKKGSSNSHIYDLTARLDDDVDLRRSMYNKSYSDYQGNAEISSSRIRDRNSRYFRASHFDLGSQASDLQSVTRSAYVALPPEENSVTGKEIAKKLAETHVLQPTEKEVPPMGISITRDDFRPLPQECLSEKRDSSYGAYVRGTHFTLGTSTDEPVSDYSSHFVGHTARKESACKPVHVPVSKSNVICGDVAPTGASTQRSDFTRINADKQEYDERMTSMANSKRLGRESFVMGNPDARGDEHTRSLTKASYGKPCRSERLELKRHVAVAGLISEEDGVDPDSYTSTVQQSSYRPWDKGALGTKPEIRSLRATTFTLGYDAPNFETEVKSQFKEPLDATPAEKAPLSVYKSTGIADRAGDTGQYFTTSHQAAYRPVEVGVVHHTVPRHVKAHYFHEAAGEYKSVTQSDFIAPETMDDRTKKGTAVHA